MTNHEIDSLMKRIACGDIEALEALYKGMSKPVYFYVLRILGSPEAAEDVMQDTFISVMSNCRNYRESEKGSSWIFTVARNKAIDFCRKRKNVIPLDEAESLPDTENSIEKTESKAAFLQMLSPLNDKERDIVMLRLLSDMTLTQVARELDMPKGSVFWAYNNAVKKLRKLHKGESGDEK